MGEWQEQQRELFISWRERVCCPPLLLDAKAGQGTRGLEMEEAKCARGNGNEFRIKCSRRLGNPEDCNPPKERGQLQHVFL